MAKNPKNKNLIIIVLVIAVLVLGGILLTQKNKKSGVSIEVSEDGISVTEH